MMHPWTFLSRLAAATPLGLTPVRVRTGLAKGARWTLAPFSANWRSGGGESDVKAGIGYLHDGLRGCVFWDFGAHFGIHSVGIAMNVGPQGEVVAFEPDPVAFARLKHHVEINKLNNVRLFAAAASDSPGTGTLYTPGRRGFSNSHFIYNPADDMAGVKFCTVEMISPDELVATEIIRPPNLLKIDVQGHGHRAIAGSIKSIETTKPVIVFSNHSDSELNGTRALLEPLGYHPMDLEGRPIDWSEISECVLVTQVVRPPSR